MDIVYIDDSMDNKSCIFSALIIPVKQWKSSFEAIRGYRRHLFENYGIYVRKELHAWKFVSGKGHISKTIVPKGLRAQIFKETLQFMAALPEARLLNTYFPRSQEQDSFAYLMNRLNVNVKKRGSNAILICDEGKEAEITRLTRKMKVFNPIPSKYETWEDGKSSKNIVLNHIIEDPVFKNSEQSYFIQLVDFAAYALLRHLNPLESKTKYGLDNAYDLLQPLFVPQACRYDQSGRGIITPISQ